MYFTSFINKNVRVIHISRTERILNNLKVFIKNITDFHGLLCINI